MQCEITERLPSAEEYNDLRRSVGWGTYDQELITRALPQSLYSVCADVNGRFVGMARIVGDGGLVFYIQDVAVHPDFQRQGIGKRMMDKIMEYIRAHASHNTIVALMSAYGKERFYEQYGFVRRPTDRLGCGMTIFW